ncbi:MAG TPA: Spy/CpxP family protein refolding chaperone [Casimicrobiaceae bacterium]|nr:Spy/CpxP family protein refolding chaperone [Casimicrobiaceae bacterium]
MSIAALFVSAASPRAVAQYSGRQRDRGDTGSTRSSRQGGDNARATAPVDPVIAIERELPSLRIDLKLTTEQAPLFDSFERQVRNTAEAGRLRARHVSAFRLEDASPATADTVLSTITDDDIQRADAARSALERMTALYSALTPDQRKQFDRRIIQALREPLGNS